MLAKCANPSCTASFRYLREGKLFRLELVSERRYEHFWLCSDCCRTLTLAVDGRVVARPLDPITTTRSMPPGQLRAA